LVYANPQSTQAVILKTSTALKMTWVIIWESSPPAQGLTEAEARVLDVIRTNNLAVHIRTLLNGTGDETNEAAIKGLGLFYQAYPRID
jgi:hypothetical protein